MAFITRVQWEALTAASLRTHRIYFLWKSQAHKGKNKGKYIRFEHLVGDMPWKYRGYRGLNR